MTHSLQVESISFAYDAERPVFRSVSTQLDTGEVAGIVGPNGSGKSTMLRCMCGLLKPSTGRVLLDGRSLHSISLLERARVLAFLPQFVDPAFALTAFEVVCLGRYPHVGALSGFGPHDREVAARCMRDTETADLKDRDFLTLSGGERQRVLVASILAQEPSLLLLDEPTSALDIHHQIEIFALLKRLAKDGYGIAVVTHDLNLAAQFCNRLVLMTSGHGLLASGSPAEVLTESLLSEAYSASIRVCAHPITGTPLVTAEAPRETI
ncbi:MAG: ABC transporter ATP-binding protein [Candidatus Hydrogenedentes bacterium]|nr:ABC transporter ATP-binding protein [Candidatus Hydrogenedentota bacterium]